jgi:FtsZ-binding cell division protein ZapB
MTSATAKPVPTELQQRLIGLWSQIEGAAFQALEARMQDRTKNLQGRLDERSTREVANITAVFQELEKSIRETLETKDDNQLQFDWTVDEKSQRERDIGSLRTRLQELPTELAREVDHLKSRYRDPQPRLFPVAVTFLVPPQAVSALQGGPR